MIIAWVGSQAPAASADTELSANAPHRSTGLVRVPQPRTLPHPTTEPSPSSATTSSSATPTSTTLARFGTSCGVGWKKLLQSVVPLPACPPHWYPHVQAWPSLVAATDDSSLAATAVTFVRPCT